MAAREIGIFAFELQSRKSAGKNRRGRPARVSAQNATHGRSRIGVSSGCREFSWGMHLLTHPWRALLAIEEPLQQPLTREEDVRILPGPGPQHRQRRLILPKPVY